MDENNTITFSLKAVKEEEMRLNLTAIYNAFIEKGEGGNSTVNPINQIVGYILSEDPTYITKHNNARAIARKLDRDELLAALVRNYLKL